MKFSSLDLAIAPNRREYQELRIEKIKIGRHSPKKFKKSKNPGFGGFKGSGGQAPLFSLCRQARVTFAGGCKDHTMSVCHYPNSGNPYHPSTATGLANGVLEPMFQWPARMAHGRGHHIYLILV